MEPTCKQRSGAQMPAIGALGPASVLLGCRVKDLTMEGGICGNLRSHSKPHPSVGEVMETSLK